MGVSVTKWKKKLKDLSFAWGLVRRRPFSVLIQLTNRCNMKCSFCSFWSQGAHPNEEVTLEDYRRIAAQMAEVGTFLVSLEGGEPFLRKDLIEIVEIFSKEHLTVLYTNGWLVNPEKARALFDAGLHQVGVSVDFASAEKHDEKRCLSGAFDRAWKAVEAFKESASNGKKQVHVMTVLMEENRSDLEALLQMSAKYGVSHCFTLLSLYGSQRNQGGEEWPKAPFSEELLDLWKKYPHLMMFRDYLGKMDSFFNREKMPLCRAGNQSFNIDHLGQVSLCIEKINKPLGDLRKESLKSILPRLKNLSEVAQCQDCWTLCRGFSQLLGGGGTLRSWLDLSTRMKV